MGMNASISVVTLGVEDLDRALAFYRDGLGLPSQGIVGTEFEGGAVAFFRLAGGLILALWPRESLARETGLAPSVPMFGAAGFSLGHNVDSRAAVDRVMAEAAAAGARIIAAGEDRAWGGYSGYFQDLDGYLWEVVWNPELAAIG
jgi:catechol 2,3-dioxygenase-like lactoylglutathione lyase family enzyme